MWKLGVTLGWLVLTVVLVPLQTSAQQPAVSGLNAKLIGEGGIYSDKDHGMAEGAITVPLGQSFGNDVVCQ